MLKEGPHNCSGDLCPSPPVPFLQIQSLLVCLLSVYLLPCMWSDFPSVLVNHVGKTWEHVHFTGVVDNKSPHLKNIQA